METNGLKATASVLSCSALKFVYDCYRHTYQKIDCVDRYYFPREKLNKDATRINGISQQLITEKRDKKNWPKYFSDDTEIEIFLRDSDIIVAHNTSFDLKFINFKLDSKTFCTMKNNAIHFGYIPSLKKTANYYNIPFESEKLHNSLYDAEITEKIFFRQIATYGLQR